MSNHLIAPSILAANYGHLDKDFEMLNASKADWVHVDVMDGIFVPNISFGQMLVKQMAKVSKLPLDVHLMICDPERYVDSFKECGADTITFHIEATNHAHRLIQHLKSIGVNAGVALNPQTNVDTLDDVLEDLDMVCLMSVNPGFGGQKFIYRTLDKIRKLKAKIIERNLNVKIEIDGGVGLQNAEAILKAGADVLVAGSSVFKSENPPLTIERLKAIEINNFDI
ncbi:MAG: ribulose-phosphate 3-epimerase [Saprospiraceae bacterium]|nr:ribulose-phosphate 3-epimerase [Bacteroidia bacterium]NNE16603.1 ribulose-phosphate 3-epimerase [Saprospiraceae bacterium]NNL93776.1 ribulose-phosphate 3-epimerase [Saprospiraceae bacterium]